MNMAMKPVPKTIYRTAKGAQIDMLKMINQNEMTIAVGNAKVNARGDKLGPGGTVIKKRDDSVLVPDQINVRPVAIPEIAAPVVKSTNKNVKDMDPEGDE
jgi:hypothetical protein